MYCFCESAIKLPLKAMACNSYSLVAENDSLNP